MRALPTLRQLRYLVALDEHRHFGRAAEACLVTQSTLSAGLQELENLLGVVLVERTKRRVLMTPLGNQIADRARGLLRDAEDLADLAQAAGEALTGPLRLGVIPTIGPFLLHRVLPGLRAAYPRLRLELREERTAVVLERLNAGDLDVGLIAFPWPTDDLEVAIIADDPFVVALSPDHPLAREPGPVPTVALAQAEMLLLEEGNCLKEHALAACSLAPARAGGIQATSLHTLVQMVAGGLGMTVLPKLAVDGDILRGTNLVTRPLLGGEQGRQIGLCWRRSSPRAEEFRLLAAEIGRLGF